MGIGRTARLLAFLIGLALALGPALQVSAEVARIAHSSMHSMDNGFWPAGGAENSEAAMLDCHLLLCAQSAAMLPVRVEPVAPSKLDVSEWGVVAPASRSDSPEPHPPKISDLL